MHFYFSIQIAIFTKSLLLQKIMLKHLTFIMVGGVTLLTSCGAGGGQTAPEWLETDSAAAISQRLNSDFSLSMEEAKKQLKELYPGITDEDIERYIAGKDLEVRVIDGKRKMHRKSPRNLKLLNEEIGEPWQGRGADATDEEIAWIDSVTNSSAGKGDLTNTLYVKYRFSVDVPRHDFLVEDTLRVWVPLPIESERQHGVKIISTSHDNYITSTSSESKHNTVYFEQPVSIDSDSILHFEYVGEYNVSAQYFSPEYILDNIKEYDVDSEIYKEYTSVEYPHIIRMDSLANTIVGDEKCPFKQSELVYDYIIVKYPWAGAREYSTIPCIPQYVVEEDHGDCGQVALLYISIMRSLGVPARWESGWMIHPGQKNLHDWAEVYFEGVGWVPVDASFGRYTRSGKSAVKNFYSTGMDQYRFATNKGVCSTLYPPKKFLRSETVDFQMGEVECSKGNLFYPGWKKRLDILEMKYVNK